MMSVKIYSILKAHGEQIFSENVEYLHDLAEKFAVLVKARLNFELAIEPESNIVCFRLIPSNISLNEFNSAIRKQLLQEGKFYIVQTTLKENVYLRVSLMNPLTTETDLKALLDEIERIGNQISGE
jgi:L-2,4-diaminobutyrate decarboxylase